MRKRILVCEKKKNKRESCVYKGEKERGDEKKGEVSVWKGT